MPKYLIFPIFFILGFTTYICAAQVGPLSTPKEPRRPIITYVPSDKIQIVETPGEPDAIRILCNSLRGKGEIALTEDGLTKIFPLNCPERPLAPFD